MRDDRSAVDLDLRYHWDRRVDARLVDLARPGAGLGALTSWVQESPHPITLDLWADHDAHLQRIIVSVGLRRVVEITWQPHRLRVDVARIVRDPRLAVPAGVWLPIAQSPRVAAAVVGLVAAAAPGLARGSTIAASGLLASHHYRLVATRFLGTFPGRARSEVVGALAADLLDAVASGGLAGFIPALKPAADALLVDGRGGLVVAEVESARAAEVAYAPAQALLCLRLLRLWAGTSTAAVPDRGVSVPARAVLGDVLDARQRSGMTFGAATNVEVRAPSSALVAIEAGLSSRLRDRLLTVWSALAASGIPEAAELRVAEFDRSGAASDIRL